MPKVLVSSDAYAHRVTLNDPPLNILDLAMLGELREALKGIVPDRHALVIAAAGERAFSAGASVQDHMGDRIETMLGLFHDCFRILARLDLVTVAIVQGPALGGGCELALACDFVLAGEPAVFGLPEIGLGVFPPVASWQLSRRTAPKRGLEMILTGEPVSAAEAERLGLVNRVFPPGELRGGAEEWMARICRHSASSVRIAKRAFRIAAAEDFDTRLAAIEKLYLGELMSTGDAAEGLAAFIEKRPPEWKGR